MGRLLLAAAALVLATGCAPADGSPAAPAPTDSRAGAGAASAVPTPTSVGTRAADPKLRRELVAMLAADQKDRSDPDAGVGGDQERTERLAEIVDRYGWPTRTLVGEDGATAAWAIAQHSDLDPTFQRRMLGLMREAADAGEADPGDLAYLTDRVAVNAGQPQAYGTQGGCGPDGKPSLAPVAEPDRVDQLRAEAGLPTVEEYLAELAAVCAQSQ